MLSYLRSKTKPTYPRLMQNKDTGTVVLFSEPCVGVVIVPGDSKPLGHLGTSWNMATFVDLPPGSEVVLEA